MKKIITIIAMTAGTAMADEWTGHDKTQHAAVGAAIGAAVTAATKDPLMGCAAATLAGAAKEVYDSQNKHKHTASAKDFIVTAAFGCFAAKGTALIVAPNKIMFRWEF